MCSPTTLLFNSDVSSVAHFFVDIDPFVGRKRVFSISTTGKVCSAFCSSAEYHAIKDFFDRWAQDSIVSGSTRASYEYPLWCCIRSIKILLFCSCCIGILAIAGLICILANMALYSFVFMLIAVVHALLLVLGLRGVIRNHHSIICKNDSIIISCFNGHVVKYRYEDVSTAQLTLSLGHNCYVRFSDGRVLRHLERVSYWPILRQKLLDAIENNQKKQIG